MYARTSHWQLQGLRAAWLRARARSSEGLRVSVSVGIATSTLGEITTKLLTPSISRVAVLDGTGHVRALHVLVHDETPSHTVGLLELTHEMRYKLILEFELPVLLHDVHLHCVKRSGRRPLVQRPGRQCTETEATLTGRHWRSATVARCRLELLQVPLRLLNLAIPTFKEQLRILQSGLLGVHLVLKRQHLLLSGFTTLLLLLDQSVQLLAARTLCAYQLLQLCGAPTALVRNKAALAESLQRLHGPRLGGLVIIIPDVCCRPRDTRSSCGCCIADDDGFGLNCDVAGCSKLLAPTLSSSCDVETS
mmetsp:Transcript_50673/g.135027  ORF Transcript_50673/g.135027 Transcript_50673/m.135027 type:complete len:306 (+) Transcript_50673:119-1036(+)